MRKHRWNLTRFAVAECWYMFETSVFVRSHSLSDTHNAGRDMFSVTGQ